MKSTTRMPLELAQALFRYDPETGKLYWKIKGPARKATGAGGLDSKGYYRVTYRRTEYKVHNIAWLLHYGVWPSEELHHINKKPHDNRIINLEDITHRENMSRCGFRK